jgi:hypothetical protein
MHRIEIDWKPIAKWGAIGGAAALGVYLIYRGISSGISSAKGWVSSGVGEVKGVVLAPFIKLRNFTHDAKKRVGDLAAKGVAKVEDLEHYVIDEQFKKREKDVEGMMEKAGVPASARSAIIYGVLGIPGTFVVSEAIREYIKHRPKEPTTEEKSIAAQKRAKKVIPTEKQKKAVEKVAKIRVVAILSTSLQWVDSNWEKILAVLSTMSVGRALAESSDVWAVLDDLASSRERVAGFRWMVKKVAGKPPYVRW